MLKDAMTDVKNLLRKKNKGRLRKRFMDVVERDLNILKVQNWKFLAKRRKKYSRKPRSIKGCVVFKMMMIVLSY